jgi:predicted nucleic acid-binding Zn ribbon protein
MKHVRVEDEQWVSDLSAEWPTLVGEAVSRHTRPGRLERGELRVFVDSAVWLSELKRWGGPKVLSNLTRRFGPSRIRAVRFEMDPDGGAGNPRT